MYDTAAEEMGKVFVTTELGGGGTATARTVGDRQARRAQCPDPRRHPRGRDRAIALDRARHAVRATASPSASMTGLVEPCVDLGETVREGRRHRPGLAGRSPRRRAGRISRRHGRHSGRPPFPRPGQDRRLPGGDRTDHPVAATDAEPVCVHASARDRIDQAPGIGVLRSAHDLFGRAVLDDLAEIEDVDALGHLPHDRQVVRDEEVGEAQLLPAAA